MTETLDQTLTAYDAWLDRQPLAAKTRIAYRFQVRQYGAYVAQCPLMADDPLRTPFDSYREVPLNAEVREVLRLWLKDRTRRFPQTSDPAVFLNPQGKRLSARAIDLVVRRIGADAHLEPSLSPCLAPYLPDQSRSPWK